MNLQSAFLVLAALLGPSRARGGPDVPQPRHQAEGAGVDGCDNAEFLLPGLAQPGGTEMVLTQPLVEVAPEGDRAVAVALRQGRRSHPGFVAFEPTQERAEALLGAGDQVLQRGAVLGQHPDQENPEMHGGGQLPVSPIAAVRSGHLPEDLLGDQLLPLPGGGEVQLLGVQSRLPERGHDGPPRTFGVTAYCHCPCEAHFGYTNRLTTLDPEVFQTQVE